MTNPPIYVAAAWETLNRRKHDKAILLCKDYGLAPLLKMVYIGTIKKNELNKLAKKFRQIFSGKRDNLFLVPLCKSCLTASPIPYNIKARIIVPAKFEIVG